MLYLFRCGCVKRDFICNSKIRLVLNLSVDKEGERGKIKIGTNIFLYIIFIFVDVLLKKVYVGVKEKMFFLSSNEYIYFYNKIRKVK